MVEASSESTHTPDQFRTETLNVLAPPQQPLAEEHRFNLEKEEDRIDTSVWEQPAPAAETVTAPTELERLKSSVESMTPRESINDISAIGDRIVHFRYLYATQ